MLVFSYFTAHCVYIRAIHLAPPNARWARATRQVVFCSLEAAALTGVPCVAHTASGARVASLWSAFQSTLRIRVCGAKWIALVYIQYSSYSVPCASVLLANWLRNLEKLGKFFPTTKVRVIRVPSHSLVGP